MIGLLGNQISMDLYGYLLHWYVVGQESLLYTLIQNPTVKKAKSPMSIDCQKLNLLCHFYVPIVYLDDKYIFAV